MASGALELIFLFMHPHRLDFLHQLNTHFKVSLLIPPSSQFSSEELSFLFVHLILPECAFQNSLVSYYLQNSFPACQSYAGF